MRGIALYVEGGGDSNGTRSQLRQGLDAFLAPQKRTANQRGFLWRTVMCGPRSEAFKAFCAATRTSPDDFVVLLVDAESAVEAQTDEGRVEHLRRRDGWTFDGVAPDRVHFMTQCMEAWIVADGEALAAHYGKGFRPDDLPRTQPLDGASKESLLASLRKAVRDTARGDYDKIRDASGVLARLRPATVSARCVSFANFVSRLDAALREA